jgi:8-hydroxy-5-deazaflavin:NADPH oxidoreductase
MKIAIIGAGKIGGTIGSNWAKAGHEVVYGLRDPSKRKDAQIFERATTGAAAVLLAIPGGAVVDFVRTHAGALNGKILIDATNNFGPSAASPNSFPAIAALVPKAQLFRAFNTYGWDVSANPRVGATPADLFYCGPEGPAKQTVEQLIADVGYRPVWVGGTDQADTVDGVLRLWFTLAARRGRRIAFQLLADQPTK